jgi:hypothetical protein
VFVLLGDFAGCVVSVNESINKFFSLQVAVCIVDPDQNGNQGRGRECYEIIQNKKASRRGGYTNQIPLTIKPYPTFKL